MDAHEPLLELLASLEPAQREQGRELLAGLGLTGAEQDALRREAARRRVAAGVAWAQGGRPAAPQALLQLVALASPELRVQARWALEALLAPAEAEGVEPYRVVEVPGEDVLEIGRWERYAAVDDWTLAFAPFTVQQEPEQTWVDSEDPRWIPVFEGLLDALWRPASEEAEEAEPEITLPSLPSDWAFGDAFPPNPADAERVWLRQAREERERQSENPGQVSLFAPLFSLAGEE